MLKYNIHRKCNLDIPAPGVSCHRFVVSLYDFVVSLYDFVVSLYDFVVSLYDFVVSLYDFVISLYDFVISLYDFVISLYDFVISLYDFGGISDIQHGRGGNWKKHELKQSNILVRNGDTLTRKRPTVT